ncbi:MAG: site-specific DNA-methyltransferase [Verrucomicrobiota bacterium]
MLELHLSDCIEGMRQQLPDESVDLVVTSPPYNLGINYGKYEDKRPLDEYLDWCKSWSSEIKRVLKPSGSFFLNIGAAPSNPLLPYQLLLTLTPELFVLQNTFHWIKSITVQPRTGDPISAGHFKPINSKRYVNDCHEFLYHFTKKGDVPLDRRAAGVPYADKSNIARWGHTGGEDRRCRGNTWFVPYQTIKSRAGQRPHPATFPVELATMCIRLVGGERSEITMLEPFLGIGHAGLAAKEEAVGRFIGFEIDVEYFAEAKDRLETLI